MGVTIHFEGKVKTPTAYSLLIDELRDYATAHGWPSKDIAEQEITLKRVRDEQNWDYCGPTLGLVLSPDSNSDPLRFEFDKDYYVQEYVKTQFAGVETHVAIINLLRRVQPFFDFLAVEDEGDYWTTSDERVLADHLQKCDQALQQLLVKHPNGRGPVRLPGGRIVDFIS